MPVKSSIIESAVFKSSFVCLILLLILRLVFVNFDSGMRFYFTELLVCKISVLKFLASGLFTFSYSI